MRLRPSLPDQQRLRQQLLQQRLLLRSSPSSFEYGAVFPQPVFVAHVDRDGAIAAQVRDVLVDKRERRVRVRALGSDNSFDYSNDSRSFNLSEPSTAKAADERLAASGTERTV
ncbi:MAG TPA: hypothetical protein VNN80_14055 [Polyangiaceae bacterium]|nr:hypothetical protein [Polyangiaceae bacterium]